MKNTWSRTIILIIIITNTRFARPCTKSSVWINSFTEVQKLSGGHVATGIFPVWLEAHAFDNFRPCFTGHCSTGSNQILVPKKTCSSRRDSLGAGPGIYLGNKLCRNSLQADTFKPLACTPSPPLALPHICVGSRKQESNCSREGHTGEQQLWPQVQGQVQRCLSWKSLSYASFIQHTTRTLGLKEKRGANLQKLKNEMVT